MQIITVGSIHSNLDKTILNAQLCFLPTYSIQLLAEKAGSTSTGYSSVSRVLIEKVLFSLQRIFHCFIGQDILLATVHGTYKP